MKPRMNADNKRREPRREARRKPRRNSKRNVQAFPSRLSSRLRVVVLAVCLNPHLRSSAVSLQAKVSASCSPTSGSPERTRSDRLRATCSASVSRDAIRSSRENIFRTSRGQLHCRLRCSSTICAGSRRRLRRAVEDPSDRLERLLVRQVPRPPMIRFFKNHGAGCRAASAGRSCSPARAGPDRRSVVQFPRHAAEVGRVADPAPEPSMTNPCDPVRVVRQRDGAHLHPSSGANRRRTATTRAPPRRDRDVSSTRLDRDR